MTSYQKASREKFANLLYYVRTLERKRKKGGLAKNSSGRAHNAVFLTYFATAALLRCCNESVFQLLRESTTKWYFHHLLSSCVKLSFFAVEFSRDENEYGYVCIMFYRKCTKLQNTTSPPLLLQQQQHCALPRNTDIILVGIPFEKDGRYFTKSLA